MQKTNSQFPLVSVLISVFNGDEYIEDCIQSILSQDYENLEIILIDDCSSDKTSKIINKFKDKRLRTFRNKKNLGLTKSLNIGLKKCRGDYIARIDHDDMCLKNRISYQIKEFQKNPRNFVCFSSYYLWDIKNKSKQLINESKNNKNYRERLKRGQGCFLHSTAMIKRPLKGNLLYPLKYDENFQIGQDQALWIKIISKSDPIIIEEPLVIARRKHSSSISYKRSILRMFIVRFRLICLYNYYFLDSGALTIIKATFLLLIELSKTFLKRRL